MRLYAKNKITRMLAAVLIILFLLSVQAIPVSAATSGSCGENLEWSYAAGTLTITGSGSMYNFTELDMTPWYEYANDIVRVVLSDKLSYIGTLAFCECRNLRFVTVPDSVVGIGNMAFYNCESLEMLSLGNALRKIGNNAFYNCKSLKNIRLPYALESIGNQAFYRCEAITNITIPANVSEMGTSVFAYCKSLIRADIKARLDSLPEWTFFGCESLKDVVLVETFGSVGSYTFRNCEELSTVYFDGNEKKAENIMQNIVESVPSFSEVGYISQSTPTDTIYSAKAVENADGTVTQSNIKIREDEYVKIVTVVDRTHSVPTINEDGEIVQPTDSKDSYTANLTVVVEDKQGWDSVQTIIKDALKDVNDTYSGSSKHENTQLTLQIKDGGFEGDSILPEIAERDMKVTVVTSNGAEWRFECEHVKKDEIPSNTNFSYTVDNATADTCEKLGTEFCYQVKFEESVDMKAEVLIPLPSAEYSNAFLYQIENDGSHTLLQAVAVDQNANAHFYVSSVDSDTSYVVGVNVPGESTDNVIIPDELLSQYGDNVHNFAQREYVITGVKSSWGLSFMQVTWIMLGVLAACIVVVGVVMVIWNKRRLNKLRSKA